MAITLVTTDLGNYGGGADYATFTFNTTPSIGDTLVVYNRFRTTSITITSVTCTSEADLTLGTLYSPVGTGFNDPSHQVAYLSNVTTSDEKVIRVNYSGTPTGTPFMEGFILQGCDNSDALGAEINTNSNAGAAPIVGTLTTTAANSAIIAMVECMGGNVGAGSGLAYTDLAISNISWYSDGEYILDAGAVGAKTVDVSVGTNRTFGLTAVEILMAAVAGGSYPYHIHKRTNNFRSLLAQ